MTFLSYENPCIALVVDRETRRVLDCDRVPDVWNARALIERHDLNKVDVILRMPTETQPLVVEGELEEPPEAPLSEPAPDDDVPF